MDPLVPPHRQPCVQAGGVPEGRAAQADIARHVPPDLAAGGGGGPSPPGVARRDELSRFGPFLPPDAAAFCVSVSGPGSAEGAAPRSVVLVREGFSI